MTEIAPVEALTAAAAELTIGHDGDEYVLGRPDVGIYAAVPEPGAVFIRALQHGASLESATREASEVAGEDVNGAEFLAGLAAAGLLGTTSAAPDTETSTGQGDVVRPKGRPIRWVYGVPQRVAARLFGRVAWIGYGLALVVGVVILLASPDLRPTYTDVWFLDDWALATIAMFPISLFLAAVHELWHWLAGRAVGCPAVFRLSHRGPFVAFETDLSQIVALPRRRRYGVFLAGMAVDALIAALALCLRRANAVGLLSVPVVIDRLAAAIVFVQVVALLSQVLLVFLRSDGYAVLANLLRCHNLYRATWLTAKQRLFRLSEGEREEFGAIGEHDRDVARWFSLVYLVGFAGVLWLAVAWLMPSLVTLSRWTVHRLGSTTPADAGFWTAVAMLVYLAFYYVVPPILALRERRLRKQGRLL